MFKCLDSNLSPETSTHRVGGCCLAGRVTEVKLAGKELLIMKEAGIMGVLEAGEAQRRAG